MPLVNDETVRVELGARSYDVVVGLDVLDALGAHLTALGFRGRCGLVTSERVGALYRSRAERSLALAGFQPIVVQIPDGEEHKTLATLSGMFDSLLRAGIERGTPPRDRQLADVAAVDLIERRVLRARQIAGVVNPLARRSLRERTCCREQRQRAANCHRNPEQSSHRSLRHPASRFESRKSRAYPTQTPPGDQIAG